MPRIGRHPLKNKNAKNESVVHQKVTVTTIVYIPMLAGYWQESLEVLKLFFESLYVNTGQPFDLMVFDNGSCEEVRTYLLDLQENSKIQYLVFSQQNLKKLGALNYLLSAAPGEYIAYADSDVYFLPGWLDESLKVLDTFPEVAKVTAIPIAGGDSTNLPVYRIAKNDPTITVKTGILIPEEFIRSHSASLGQTFEAYSERTKNRNDVVLIRDNCEALLSGSDFQFTITQRAVKVVLPLKIQDPSEYFDPIYSPVLERRLSSAGYWQVCTTDYLVHHMGNRVPDLEKEIGRVKPNMIFGNRKKQISNSSLSKGLIRRVLMNRVLRNFLTKLYLLS
ncbi:MAG: glycosyltransferase family A protein, partial [Chloroflexota bacterium]